MDRQSLMDDEDEGYFSRQYNQLWKMVIQPKRNTFAKEVLGGKTRRFGSNLMYVREEGTIENKRRERIEYSFYKLHKTNDFNSDNGMCLIYMHAHGGNRLESLNLLPFCAKLQVSFCCFDFSGSGNSDGHYCTLGFQEADDCQAIIQTLIKKHGVHKFILWGRSMGAVAIILHASKYSSCLKYLVLDSPFHDVEQAVKDIGNSYISLGEYVSSLVFNVIKDEILKRLYIDFTLFKPIDYCSSCKTPCIFLAAEDDNMVLPDRVAEMLNEYGCTEKSMVMIKGNHMTTRENKDLDIIFKKMAKYLNIDYVRNAADLKITNDSPISRLNEKEKLVKKINPVMPKTLYSMNSLTRMQKTTANTASITHQGRLRASRDSTPISENTDTAHRSSVYQWQPSSRPVANNSSLLTKQSKPHLKIFDNDDDKPSPYDDIMADNSTSVIYTNAKFSEYLAKTNKGLLEADIKPSSIGNLKNWTSSNNSILQKVKESSQMNKIFKANSKSTMIASVDYHTDRPSTHQSTAHIYEPYDHCSTTHANVNLSITHSVYTPAPTMQALTPTDRRAADHLSYYSIVAEHGDVNSSLDVGRQRGNSYKSAERTAPLIRYDMSLDRARFDNTIAQNDTNLSSAMIKKSYFVKESRNYTKRETSTSPDMNCINLGWRKTLHLSHQPIETLPSYYQNTSELRHSGQSQANSNAPQMGKSIDPSHTLNRRFITHDRTDINHTDRIVTYSANRPYASMQVTQPSPAGSVRIISMRNMTLH